ncbi:hypothetical protein LGK95_05260 [Clostridium algoriphilum]|uniref:hypothetical protein n=1 Tax=Clostridium algoriphilum TaxID=198347 RepID=UPI001CF3020E|nr:hypothetical protein [Clostridium algoriphilum]MCB2292929.1 hypothetical protein [Clostridium algoriphilum]
MKRPSMFSKHYEKEKKKRRKIILLVIIIPIIGLSIFLKTDFKGLLNKSKENKEAQVEKKPEVVVKDQKTSKKPKATHVKNAVKTQAFVVSLSDGQKISIQYDVQAAEKSIKGISNSKGISYDISPSKKAIVIQSTKNQDLLYVDVNKVSKDITKKIHKSSKNQIYPKNNKLKSDPNYIWSITPKFINEDNIVYVSELPWMNEKAMQYIWKVNVKTSEHVQVKPASGKKITFKNITSKGLEATIDGNAVYVTPIGKVIK